MLLYSPVALILAGLVVARVAKARRVWRRHGLFTVKAGMVVVALYTVVSLGLLTGRALYVHAAESVGIADPAAWFVHSGVLELPDGWSVGDPVILMYVVVSFMLYPFWYGFGVQAGHWLFGRSPKQTGILGLLR